MNIFLYNICQKPFGDYLMPEATNFEISNAVNTVIERRPLKKVERADRGYAKNEIPMTHDVIAQFVTITHVETERVLARGWSVVDDLLDLKVGDAVELFHPTAQEWIKTEILEITNTHYITEGVLGDADKYSTLKSVGKIRKPQS